MTATGTQAPDSTRGSRRTTPCLPFAVESIAFWAPTLPSWHAAEAAFNGRGALADPPATRPAPQLLAPAERRRVPDSVALALEVASQAVQGSGRDPKTLATIFTSSEGDLSINDYMCSTLATSPALISPTKFHNSVHNAAAGYWTIATGCMAASTATSGFDASFAGGLLEAATQVAAEREPVLLVAFDVPAVGALASVTRSVGLLACAFVLAPQGHAGVPASQSNADERASQGDRDAPASFEASLVAVESSGVPPLRSSAARSLAGNAMSGCLPWLEALATKDRSATMLPLGHRLALQLRPTVPSA